MKKTKRKLSKKTIRFRRLFCFSVLLITSIVVCVVLSLTVLFKIDRIHVEGHSRYSNEEIIQSSQILYGSNLFLLNKTKVSQNIEKALPYIEDVKIIKQIPNDVIVRVNESTPLALIKTSDSSYVVISKKYKVLDQIESPIDGICIVNGLEIYDVDKGTQVSFKYKEQGETFVELVKLLDTYSMTASEIDVSNSSKVSFLYESRINVILGIPEKLDYKIKTASHILNNNIKQQEHGTLDLSLVLENEHTYFSPDESAQKIF